MALMAEQCNDITLTRKRANMQTMQMQTHAGQKNVDLNQHNNNISRARAEQHVESVSTRNPLLKILFLLQNSKNFYWRIV